MKRSALILPLLLSLLLQANNSFSDGVAVKLASLPVLSPDGSTLVFEYNQDLWRVASAGGRAERLTQHPAYDTRPVFSPDGQWIAFSSNRDDSWQVFVMPAAGGNARQVTFHSEGSTPLDWYPDGEHLLVRGARVQRGYMQTRFFKVSTAERRAEELLFDAYGQDADLSNDGRRLLFTRFGEGLYRKGYRGSAASQIWLYDGADSSFTRVCNDPSGNRSPLWKPDGSGFYYVCQRDGCFNIWEHDLENASERQLTFFDDASVIIPGISRDGGTIVFRQLFDFYRLDPRDPDSLKKIDITVAADDAPEAVRRRWYSSAWNNDSDGSVDFSADALEICFTAGGDLWVMDTVLREPKLVCGDTATHERELVFAPDGESIYFLRDDGVGVNIWKAERKDPGKYWWQNDEFVLTQLTDDELYRFNLEISPKGDRLSIVQGNFELWHYDLELQDGVMVQRSHDRIYYDWSPDGKWFVSSMDDSWGNSDVWILSAYGEREPYNLSRHPNWDSNARWSPDGRIIAFTGRRFDDEIDIFYVYLRREDELRGERDRKLREAIESMEKKRGPLPEKEDTPPEPEPEPQPDVPDESPESPSTQENPGSESGSPSAEEAASAEEQDDAEDDDQFRVDFDGLADRIHRISMPGSTPSHLFWSFDSKALAFQSTINGTRGTYKIVFTGSKQPVLLSKETGTQARWIEDGSRILWMNDRVPAVLGTKYNFSVYQETDIAAYRRLGFRIAWRMLRDEFYDPALNNLDWDAIRLKYEDMAAACSSWDSFERLLEMLFGELNASHLGIDRKDSSGKEWYEEYSSGQWKRRTAHLGLIFEQAWEGPGLKIEHVVCKGPSDTALTGIEAGDILVAIDGVPVRPGDDLSLLLNGRHDRAIELTVAAEDGAERTVEIEETGYEKLRGLVREEWLDSMDATVQELSEGRLGYLNIEKMNQTSLRRFEREVFARGFDKDGLVIDVRNNGGGFIADQLLAILCHPEHAFTIQRGADISYQQGYLTTSFWSKPIVVLCNQYSASNAEIFCHAIKNMGRGKIVGVPTKGAVISTPQRRVLDIGTMQLPVRGWFLPESGLDMEFQACEPDHLVELAPGDIPSGRDPQLRKAVDVLMEEVSARKDTRRPVYASELRAKESGGEE